MTVLVVICVLLVISLVVYFSLPEKTKGKRKKRVKKLPPEIEQETGRQVGKKSWQGVEIVKFAWLTIFTVGIIYIIVAMIAGWLRILYGVVILVVLFGCIAAMRQRR